MSTIERLKELDAKATPGPWSCDSCGDIYHAEKPQIRMREQDGDNNFATTAYWKDGNPNAQLIAEMRNALPALLAVVEAAQQHLDCDGGLTHQILRNALLALNENSATE